MKFQILDHTGHTTLDITDTNDAMEKFNELVGLGSTAATRKTGDKDYTVTRQFDPTADETLFVPRMQGG
jgi:hypothetical protein